MPACRRESLRRGGHKSDKINLRQSISSLSQVLLLFLLCTSNWALSVAVSSIMRTLLSMQNQLSEWSFLLFYSSSSVCENISTHTFFFVTAYSSFLSFQSHYAKLQLRSGMRGEAIPIDLRLSHLSLSLLPHHVPLCAVAGSTVAGSTVALRQR